MNKFIIGNIAAFLSCIFLFPQIWKIYKTQNVMGIAFPTLILICITQCFWIFFALLTLNKEKSNIAILLKGLIILLSDIILIFYYLKYSKQKDHQLFYKKHNINQYL
tara:strand:- start:317 stop:637 length:321 start_codon:yes stop_codon:yes gene_type:complete